MKKFSGLILEINRKCNLSCVFCPVPKSEKELSIKKIEEILNDPLIEERVVKHNKKFPYLGISGGEPLLHSNLKEVIDFFSSSAEQVLLSTNLTLLPDGFLEQLKEKKNVHIQISLHASNPQLLSSITGKDYFDTVVSNIKTITQNIEQYRTIVNVVVNKLNEGDIVNLIELLSDLSIGYVRLYPMVALKKETERFLPSDYMRLLREVDKEITKRSLPIKVYAIKQSNSIPLESELLYISMDRIVSNTLFSTYGIAYANSAKDNS